MSPQDQAAIDIATNNAVDFVAIVNEVILFPLIALLSAVAFIVFLWGCAEYVMNANNSSARSEGVQHITWGIIGLVVMMSAWAILSIAAATFGLDDNLQNAKTGPLDSGTNPGPFPTPDPGTNPGPFPTPDPGTGPGPSPTPDSPTNPGP